MTSDDDSLDAVPDSNKPDASANTLESPPKPTPQPGTTESLAAQPAEAPSGDASPLTQVHNDQPEASSLELTVFDAKHHAIPGLGLRVVNLTNKRELLFNGTTDSAGAIPIIENIPVGTRFEVQLRTDRGDYKFAAIGTISTRENQIGNLLIPRERFEFTTYSHEGPAGAANTKKAAAIQRHNQVADALPNVARNSDKKPQVQIERDNGGNPKALVSLGMPNMFGQNCINTPRPSTGKTDIEKVQKLIEFSMKQVAWVHPKSITSETIIGQMKDGRYKIELRPDGGSGMGYKYSKGMCAKYVKIALWKAGYSPNNGDFAPGVSPARLLGPELEKAGFKNITNELPDARWAAPGDVIVYKKIVDPSGAGHVDIRTYDGYVSDFFETYIPTNAYEVIGIYRKYYDPVPNLRVRAFLKVLRSREAKGLFDRYGDSKAYRAMPGSGTFESFETHPFSSEKRFHPSGAYGITVDTWRIYLKTQPKLGSWVAITDGADKFTPMVQDRIAVAIMEIAPKQDWAANKGKTALGMIRKGDIRGGAALLASSQSWSSLPGGGQEGSYTEAAMLADFDKFFKEFQAAEK